MAERGSIASDWAWSVLAVALALGAALGWSVDRPALDWQPALAAAQPWRAVTAVFVHYSALHLAANLAGALLVSALGHAVPMPPRGVLAWLAAWPLTQWGLLLQPDLLHYGGLSGVLHAGVAIVAVHLIFAGTPARRRIGAVILAVLCAKVIHETPWQGPLRHPPGWDIAVAPLAHATGLAAGAICAIVAEWRHRARTPAAGIER